MATFDIFKVTGKSGNAIWLEKGLSTANANDYVMFNRRKLKRGEKLIIRDADGRVDMEFTKDSVITPRVSNRIRKIDGGYVYERKMTARSEATWNYKTGRYERNGKPVLKTNRRKSKNKYSRMWRMKSKRLYSWLRNPKNGTKKERRLASYILSTRRK